MDSSLKKHRIFKYTSKSNAVVKLISNPFKYGAISIATRKEIYTENGFLVSEFSTFMLSKYHTDMPEVIL